MQSVLKNQNWGGERNLGRDCINKEIGVSETKINQILRNYKFIVTNKIVEISRILKELLENREIELPIKYGFLDEKTKELLAYKKI